MEGILIIGGAIFIGVCIFLFIFFSSKRKKLLDSAETLISDGKYSEAFPVLLSVYTTGIRKARFESEANIGLSQSKLHESQKRVLKLLLKIHNEGDLDSNDLANIGEKEAALYERVRNLGNALIDGSLSGDLDVLKNYGQSRPTHDLISCSCPICLNWIRKEDMTNLSGKKVCPVCNFPLFSDS